MGGLHADERIFTLLIDAAARRGDRSLAEKWMKIATDCDIKPKVIAYRVLMDRAASKAYGALIDKAVDEGDLRAALRWMQQAHSAGMEPTAAALKTALLKAAHNGDL